MRRAIIVGILSLGMAVPAAAADGKRGRLILNGAFAASSLEFDEARTFTEFAEEGSLRASYKGDPGPGFEAGLQYNFMKSLGLLASFSLVDRDETASFDAALPHPLYLDRDRQARGDVTGLSYKEQAVHLDLVFTGSTGSLDVNLFAGATLFKVESALIDQIRYTHSYPYDNVTVSSPVPTRIVEDSPVGFNIGASLDYRLGGSFGLGAQVRFSRGTAELAPVAGQTLSIDAGGLQVGGGLRIFF